MVKIAIGNNIHFITKCLSGLGEEEVGEVSDKPWCSPCMTLGGASALHDTRGRIGSEAFSGRPWLAESGK